MSQEQNSPPARGGARFTPANILVYVAAGAVWLVILRLSIGINATPESKALSWVCLAYGPGLWGLYFLFSRRTVTQRCARFLLMTVSLALVIFLIELPALLGWVDYRRVLPGPAIPWAVHHLNRPDRERLYVRPPHLTVTLAVPCDADLKHHDLPPIMLKYDARGFRNPTDMDQADVAVIGDSFVEAVRTDQDKLMTSVLARELARTVVNLGQSAYGPQQELVVLKRVGAALKPKVVVWMFFEGNDLWEARDYAEAQRDWDKYVAGLGAFPRRTLTYNLLGNLYQRLSSSGYPVFEPGKVQKGWFREAGGGETEMLFLYPQYPLSKDEQTYFNDLAMPTLREGAAVCGEIGARFLVVFVPSGSRVYLPYIRFANAAPIAGWRPNDLPERMQAKIHEMNQAADKTGATGAPAQIEFVDLTAPLQERAARGELVYFARDSHWTPLGHRVAAERLAEYLLPGGATTRPAALSSENRLPPRTIAH